MLSIERQIGSEDARLWMLTHRTVDFTVPIVQQVIEDHVTNMRDDTVHWQTQSDGTTMGKFACPYTELSALVMKLDYRLFDSMKMKFWEVRLRNTIHRNRSCYKVAHLDFRQERSGTINH